MKKIFRYTQWALIGIILIAFLSCADKSAYQFAVVGDFQPPDDDGYKKVSHEIVKRITDSRARFVVIVGDLISGRDPVKWEQFDDLVRPIRDAGKEIYAVIGNNDCESKDTAAGFENRFGERYQYVNRSGLSMVFMDSEVHSQGYRNWQLGNEQIDWLEERPWEQDPSYNRDQLRFFFIHRPIFRSKLMRMDLTGKYGRSKPDIAERLKTLGTDAVFSGHEHLYEEKEVDGVTYFITGGGGGDLLTSGFHHFLLVTVSPEKKSWKVKVVKVETDEEPVYRKTPVSR